jgi:hypothetical protein
MIVQEIIDEVSGQLNDIDLITWDLSSHLEYINAAMEAIVNIRPDAYSIVTTMQMTSGAKQSLPTSALRLLGVKRNMGADGVTPGRAIHAVDEESLDLFEFNWSNATEEAAVKNFTYDERMPNTFYVDPPSDGTGWIEIAISRVPTSVTVVGDTLVLKDIYRNQIIQWCMYRAYSIEVDSASSRSRAATHEQSFYQLMGKKFARDVQFSPSIEAQEAQGGG